METKSVTRQRQRRWIYRGVAMLLVPLGFLLAEGAFRLFDGESEISVLNDPGFSGAYSLFLKNQEGTRYDIRPSRRRSFAPESFAVAKASNEFRIFCLGGSTVQGRPYSIQTSFTTWLELGLQAADPSRVWEVVNVGGVSYASYRLVPILQECLSYQPDLILLCTGHNEFLEGRTFAARRKVPRLVNWLHENLLHSRVFAWLRAPIVRRDFAPTRGTMIPNEVDAFLDHPRGLQAYQRNVDSQQRVIEDFELNIRKMVVAARASKVPVILIQPPSNLRDSPPFKSEHRPGLTDSEMGDWSNLWAQAQAQFSTNSSGAGRLLENSLALDDQYAETHYALGQCLIGQGLATPARRAFLEARDQDVCPLRILTPMEESLRRVARDFELLWLNAHALLESQSQLGILGNDWLVDHVHPSIRGHQLIADTVLAMMVEQGWVRPRGDWRNRERASIAKHFDSLDPLYFPRGQQRLENLRDWAQGRIGQSVMESQNSLK